MDSYNNGRYSGSNRPRINEPSDNGASRNSEPRFKGVRGMHSRDSLADYVVSGASDAQASIYDVPSPSIPVRDWSKYQPTCEDVSDEDELQGYTPRSTPKQPVKDTVRQKQHPTRRQSGREQSTPKATPAKTSRSTASSSPEASRKPSPAVDPYPKAVAWDSKIRLDRVYSNARDILPPCSHWGGMSNSIQGCHSAPVLGWDRGHFSHDTSFLDLSTSAQRLPSGKLVTPDEAYYSGSSDASDSSSGNGSELISGWWVVGHSESKTKLRACTSCLKGLEANLHRELIHFVPMEPHEVKNYKCHFSSPLVRFGWFLMLHKLKRWGSNNDSRFANDRWYMILHTLGLLGGAVANAPDACPNDNLRVGDWYSFPTKLSRSDKKARFRLDCLICPQDYQLITALFPWTLRFLDRVPADEVLQQPHLCSMRMDTIRWDSLVYTLYKGASNYDGTTPIISRTRPDQLEFYRGGHVMPWILRETTELPSLLLDRTPFDRCPGENDLIGFKWFIIPELPEFTVCHHCYATVVLPLRRTGSKIAQAFLPRPQYPIQESLNIPRLAPPSTPSSPRSPHHSRSSSGRSSGAVSPLPGYKAATFCHLYSTRMRDIFNYAAATDPVPVSVGKVKALDEQWQLKQQDWKQAMKSPTLYRAQPTTGSSGARTPIDDDKHAVAFPLVNFPTFEAAFNYLRERVLARHKALQDRLEAERVLIAIEKDEYASQRSLDQAQDQFDYLDSRWAVLE